MPILEKELRSLGPIVSGGAKLWIRQNSVHPVVASLMRRGVAFSRLPFRAARDAGMRGIQPNVHIRAGIVALYEMLCTSYEVKNEAFSCKRMDVFACAVVNRALSNVFPRKGWSKNVWDEQFVPFSSFRSAIGMALITYALYIHSSLKDGNFDLALRQCHDADSLFLLDLEKKIQASSRMRKEASSHRGKKAVEEKLKKDPKQKAKALVKECWMDWQDRKARGEKPYKSKAAFARDMLGKFDDLESQPRIVIWCGEWEEELGLA